MMWVGSDDNSDSGRKFFVFSALQQPENKETDRLIPTKIEAGSWRRHR